MKVEIYMPPRDDDYDPSHPDLEFVECDTCRAKYEARESNVLCSGCVSNRATIYKLKKEKERQRRFLGMQRNTYAVFSVLLLVGFLAALFI